MAERQKKSLLHSFLNMLIMIMRHGEAEAGVGESERHLTDNGSIQVRSVLGWAKQMGLRVDSILSSPLTRAKETASLASSIFGTTNSVDNALEPEGSPDQVYLSTKFIIVVCIFYRKEKSKRRA